MKKNRLHTYIQFFLFIKSKYPNLFSEFQKSQELEELLQVENINTVFQPILSLKEGSTVGFEVLNRPFPTALFPTTEAFYDFVGGNSSVVIVEHLLRELSFSRYSKQTQQNMDRNHLVFVNIQPQVLADPTYKSGKTLEMLNKYDISPKQVVLELTEKEAVFDYHRFESMIHHYRKQGFRIAVDDAGTGYNSLQTLIHLKPEFIKLDKTLIRDIDNRPEQQHLVELLLKFSLQNKTLIIAEGIETISELRYLQKMGIQLGQGYALGKPSSELREGSLPSKASAVRGNIKIV